MTQWHFSGKLTDPLLSKKSSKRFRFRNFLVHLFNFVRASCNLKQLTRRQLPKRALKNGIDDTTSADAICSIMNSYHKKSV